MEQFMYLLKGYGLPFLIMALICIFIVGILKTAGAFKKCSKQVKTIILFAVDVVYCCAAIPVYFKVSGIQFSTQAYFSCCATLDACILSMYSVYEALGMKKLTASILTLVADGAKELASKKADAKEKAQIEALETTARLVAQILLRDEAQEQVTTVISDSVVEQEQQEVKRNDSALHR